jgi:NDP-sugar pyrophosphorylase family protein
LVEREVLVAMKAVVLVGGEGTRMRPLTETTPKPLIPLVDRPGLDHVLDHLARHGVHEVVLSSPYLERTFHPFIQARHGDPSITWITETEPLGTGGAIVNALEALGEEPFFALNGDILTDLDLTAMLGFHRERAATVTIALHHVEDARAFGLVPTDRDGRVREFREKPQDPIPGDVNAGTYLLDPGVLRGWTPDRQISIEREIFPALIDAAHPVFGYVADAYWIDLGTPEKYLQAHFDLLEGKVRGVGYEAPWIAPNADVDVRSHVGRWVAVGAEARVGADAQVDDSVLHPGSSVGEAARVVSSVVGPGAHVGAGATVDGCVLGSGARVPDSMILRGAKVGTDVEASSD